MGREISQVGLRFIEKWEELVLYVYDDKVPKRRGPDGKLAYPEWDGGRVRGTLTFLYGHTDAAGAPKLVRGMRGTEQQANEVLASDLAPCCLDVSHAVTVPLTQHQFDTLVSFTFNCGAGNLRKLVAASGLNAGKYNEVPKHLLNYVSSKGEHMDGLVNRRNGEIVLWNTPDEPEAAAVQETFSPKAEENAPPKSMAQSKTGGAAVTIGAGGVLTSVRAAHEAAGPFKDAKQDLQDLGILDLLAAYAHSPFILVGIVIVGLAVFVWFDRRAKLQDQHV
jgi:GH24 family phage-related lysozyme (muramidase)